MINSISKKINVIFFGTSRFAVPALEELILSDTYNVTAVITNPDARAGRKGRLTKSAIKEIALRHGLNVFEPIELKSVEHSLKKLLVDADVGVLASYGKILPKSLIELFRNGIVNLHASLLPKYRGASPIQASILNGDKESGITLMLINEGIDEGEVLASKNVDISEFDKYLDLERKLANEGARLLATDLELYLDGKLVSKPQSLVGVSYTPMIQKQDGKFEWTEPALQIERKFRAFHVWPKIFTNVVISGRNTILTIIDCRLASMVESSVARNGAQPGFFYWHDKSLSVKCDPGLLILNRVKLEGTTELSALDFANGYLKKLSNNG